MQLKLLWIGVILALLVLSGSGCFDRDNSSKRTALMLGVNRLAALKPIPSEPRLQQLVLVEAAGDKVSITSLGEAYEFEVSNDGKNIAFVDDTGLFVVSTDGGKPAKVSDLSPKFDLLTDQVRVINKVMAWSPDNTHLAFVCGGDLFVVDINEGNGPNLVAKRTPDRLTTKEGSPALAPRIDGIICPDWLDNDTLVYQDYYRIYDGQWRFAYNIMKVNADGSDKKILIENAREPVVSPGKELVLYHRNDSLGGKIMLGPVDGSAEPKILCSFTDTNQEPMSYSWSKDGKYVIFDGFFVDPAANRQRAFTGEPARDPQHIRGRSNLAPSSSPDGRWIIFSTSQGPKIVEFVDDNFVHDTSEAFKPLAGLRHIQWAGGK